MITPPEVESSPLFLIKCPKLREAILRQDAQGKYFYDTTQFQFYRVPITTHANTFAQLTHDNETPKPPAGTPNAVQIDHTTPLQYQTLMFCPPNQFFSVQQVGYSPQHRNAVLEGRSGPYDVTSASNPHHVDELDLYNALFIGDYVQDGSVVNICTPYDITFLLLPFFLRHFPHNKTHIAHLNPYNHAQLDGGAATGFAPFADIIALSTMTQRLAALSRSPDEDTMPHNNSPADDVVFFWERLCYNLPHLHHILSKWCDIQHVGAGSIFSRPDDLGVPHGGDDVDEDSDEYKQQQEANSKDYFQQQQQQLFPNNDPQSINDEMNLGDEVDPFQQTMSQQTAAQQIKTTSTKKQDAQMTPQQLVTIDNQRYAYKLNYGKLFTFLSQKFWRIAYQCTQITTLVPAGLSNNPKPQSGNTMNNIPNLLPPPPQNNNAATSQQQQQPGAFQPILVSVTSDVLSLYDFNGMYQPWDSASDYIFANALCLLGNELPPSYFTTLFLPSFTSNNNKPFTTTRIGHVMYRIPDPSDSTTTTTTTTASKGGYTEFNKKGEEITVVRDSEFIPDAQTFGTKRPNPTATATPAKDNKKAKAAPEKKPLPAGQKTLSAFFGKK